MNHDNLAYFSVKALNIIRHQDRANVGVRKKGSVRDERVNRYFSDRVEKLRELYEEHYPETESRWILPPGETDGRKAQRIEVVVGEDIRPFDLPDFEEQMPKLEDYFPEDEIRDIIKFGIEIENDL